MFLDVKKPSDGELKKEPRRVSPSDKIPDGIFLQAGLAVFALCAEELYAHKQKHRCAFRSPTQAKQFACCLA